MIVIYGPYLSQGTNIRIFHFAITRLLRQIRQSARLNNEVPVQPPNFIQSTQSRPRRHQPPRHSTPNLTTSLQEAPPPASHPTSAASPKKLHPTDRQLPNQGFKAYSTSLSKSSLRPRLPSASLQPTQKASELILASGFRPSLGGGSTFGPRSGD